MKCCDKCYSTYTTDDWPAKETIDACINGSCECHTSKESGWRERFDEQFVGGFDAIPTDSPYLPELYAFITQVEATAIAQERARLREEVVKLMVPDLLGKDAAFYGTVAAREFVKIHNAALADVLALLRE